MFTRERAARAGVGPSGRDTPPPASGVARAQGARGHNRLMEEGEERVRSPKEQISTTTTTTKQDVGMEGHGEKEKWAKGQGHKQAGQQ